MRSSEKLNENEEALPTYRREASIRMKMQAVGDLIFGLYRGTPQEGEWIIACLEGAWAALVGERLAQVCRPALFEEGCLTIQILDPSWVDALQGMGAELREKIRAATHNEVRHVRFRTAAASEQLP